MQKFKQEAPKCRSIIWSLTGHQRSSTRAKSITNSQYLSNLSGSDWRASKRIWTSVASLHVLPAPSRGVLRQTLHHPLWGLHLTFSLCLSYHSAATTSEHARNTNDIKILSRKQPRIQFRLHNMSKLLLSALWNNCCYHLQTSNAVCLKGFLKSRYRAVSEFLWWIRGEADASSRVRTSNAETDKMVMECEIIWCDWNLASVKD